MKNDSRQNFFYKKLNDKPLSTEDISDFERTLHIKLRKYEKLLLINTGLTENILRIILGSSIIINVKKQTQQDDVIIRKTKIQLEKNPEKILLQANSRIYLKRIPIKILKEIIRKEKGLGKIIETGQLETYKKIIKIGYNHDQFKLYREYDIIHNDKIITNIREIFLLNNLRGL